LLFRNIRARVTAALFTLCASVGAFAVDVPTFKVDPFWPKPLPNNWILGQVAGVAVDDKDNVWVIHRPGSLTDDEKALALTPPQSKCCISAPPVVQFDKEGNVLQAWGGPGEGYDWPGREHGIHIDHKGNVWLGGNADTDGMVLKFTQQGKFLLQIGSRGPSKGNNDKTQLGKPADIEVDPTTNEAFIADGYGNRRIIVFDAETGAYKRHWGAYGKPPTDEVLPPYDPAAPVSTQFRSPMHCVEIGPDNLVYACDRVNNRVQAFKKDGTFVREFFHLRNTLRAGAMWDLTFWPRDTQILMIIVDGTNNESRLVNPSDGTIVGTFGRQGRNAGDFHWVHNVAVDSKGDIVTTEVDHGKRVQKFVVAR